MKHRILILNGTCLDVVEECRAAIESQGVELWAEQRFRQLSFEDSVELMQQCDAFIGPADVARGLPFEQHMRSSPRLRVCAIAASGFDGFDIDAFTRNGIVLAYAPVRLGAEVVADMAMGLMLAVARQIPHHHLQLSRGDTSRGVGTSLFDKTLGIVGLGNIGKHVVRRAKGFDMRVLAADPAPDRDFAAEHGVAIVSRDELLGQSDFVSLHVRLDEQTKNMISQDQFARMKRTAFIVNTARRELIDEAALVEAIQNRQIAGAALDDPPGSIARHLFGLPNVVFTPHLGNRCTEGMRAVFQSAVETALAVLNGRRPQFVVNPAVYERGLRR